MKANVTCFLMPSKVQNENIYRVRQADGTTIEGYAGRLTAQPRFSCLLDETKDGRGLVCIWGTVTVDVLSAGETEDGVAKTEVLFPDGQLGTVKSSRVFLQDKANARA